jgi:Bax protein
MKKLIIFLIPVFIVILYLYIIFIKQQQIQASETVIVKFSKEYYQIKDIKLMKKEFVKVLLPLIIAQNKINGKDKAIPPSLVLAQAAVESGWGRSYFVKEANNIFGQWTWKGDGIVPRKRDANKTHKIKIFKSLQGSIEGYMNNLNTHDAYIEFRELRKANTPFKGTLAATSMINYSGIGQKYILLLQNIIKKEKWEKYDL